MTEHIEPNLTTISAQQWGAVASAWTTLMAAHGLNDEGMAVIRHELRGSAWEALPPHLLVHRAEILDSVCRLMADRNPERFPLEYFRAAGDLVDAAPDDTSGLTA